MFLLQFLGAVIYDLTFRHREDHGHGHVLLMCGDAPQKESPLQWLHARHP